MSIARRTLLALAAFATLATPAFAQPFSSDRISVETRGAGPDVVLIPGLGSSAAVWADEAARLSATHRVHVVQVGGFAGAPAGANASGDILAPVADEIARYVAANAERPALVGHSLGGVLALLVAERHPEAVSKIAIIDALPFFSVLMDPNATAAGIAPMANGFRDRMIGASAETFRAEQEMGVARLVRTPERRGDVLAWSLASDRGVFARAAAEVMTTDLRQRLAAIQTPMLVLYAHDAVMGPPALIDGLYAQNYAAASHATLARIDGAYHFIMIDQPDALHAALAPFLASR